MGLFNSVHQWRVKRIEEARQTAERRARAKGKTDAEIAEAGEKAARRRKRRPYVIGGGH